MRDLGVSDVRQDVMYVCSPSKHQVTDFLMSKGPGEVEVEETQGKRSYLDHQARELPKRFHEFVGCQQAPVLVGQGALQRLELACEVRVVCWGGRGTFMSDRISLRFLRWIW
eukprot:758403-Hanusia_phi.AAC.1